GSWYFRSYMGTQHAVMPLEYLQTWLVPNFRGNPTHHNYWGLLNYTEQSAYVGLLMLMAAPLAWLRRSWRVLFWLALSLFSVAFAYNLPVLSLVHNLPLFNVSNGVRWPSIASIGIIFLGATGIQRLITQVQGDYARWRHVAAIALTAGAGVAGLLLLIQRGECST